MKPLVSALSAWSCIVISIFAIVILSVVGNLFKNGHRSMLDSRESTKLEDAKGVANTIFITVLVYVGFLLFCSCQAFVNSRQRSGAISL